MLDDNSVTTIREQASAAVEAAIDFAKASPLPDPDSVRDYVFA
ncbi:hypothetical protein [Nocardioides alcanivorans]|nr:hypothetical protein [Nocardioides alcanivorans]